MFGKLNVFSFMNNTVRFSMFKQRRYNFNLAPQAKEFCFGKKRFFKHLPYTTNQAPNVIKLARYFYSPSASWICSFATGYSYIELSFWKALGGEE